MMVLSNKILTDTGLETHFFKGRDSQIQKDLAIKPSSAITCYNTARLYQVQGELAEAIRHYQKAIKIQPDYAKAYNALGIVLQK
jgi:tetratricopeptide (TPR) repeat protein